MNNALKIAPPPPRRPVVELPPEPESESVAAPIEKAAPKPVRAVKPVYAAPVPAPKFNQMKEDERVQFNKRVTRGVADGFEMLAIRTRNKVPDLLEEALQLLEQRYGKVG